MNVHVNSPVDVVNGALQHITQRAQKSACMHNPGDEGFEFINESD